MNRVIAFAARLFGPRARLAGADIHDIGVGIVGHAAPHRPAAAQFPPIAAPGFGGFGQLRLLEGLGRIAGDGIKLPGDFAGFGVHRREESADRIFAAGRADDHLAAFDDARRHGEAVGTC